MQHNNSPQASAYLRFLQLARVVPALPEGMEMDANERGVLHFFLEPRILRWWMETAMRADQANTNLVDLIDAALSP